MHKSGCSSSGSDRTPESVYSEEDVALIESSGSSIAVTGSGMDLPSSSGTREEANLHPEHRDPEGRVEEENFLTEILTSPSLERRRGEIPPAAVQNLRQRRRPRSKPRNWCSSTWGQLTVLTLLLGTASFTAKMFLSLDSPTFDMTDRDVQERQDTNETAYNDTNIFRTEESPNQTQLLETGISDVQRAHVENGSRVISELSSTQRVRFTHTYRPLLSHSSTPNDSATFVFKHKAASGPLPPVLSLLAANSKRKDYQPSRPTWLEFEDTWATHLVNRT